MAVEIEEVEEGAVVCAGEDVGDPAEATTTTKKEDGAEIKVGVTKDGEETRDGVQIRDMTATMAAVVVTEAGTRPAATVAVDTASNNSAAVVVVDVVADAEEVLAGRNLLKHTPSIQLPARHSNKFTIGHGDAETLASSPHATLTTTRTVVSSNTTDS